jgi:hypothetical protein
VEAKGRIGRLDNGAEGDRQRRHRRYVDLCVSGDSSRGSERIASLIRPPLTTGVVPVQKMQRKVEGIFWWFRPRQRTCSHLVHDSHWTMSWPSYSMEWQTQRMPSLETVLRSVLGVWRSGSAAVEGELW